MWWNYRWKALGLGSKSNTLTVVFSQNSKDLDFKLWRITRHRPAIRQKLAASGMICIRKKENKLGIPTVWQLLTITRYIFLSMLLCLKTSN